MLTCEPVDIVEPNDNEVLLKMASVGICGSDVHYLVHGRIGDFVVDRPMIIGHESSGTVIQRGKNVKHLNVGDRVAIEPGVPCRTCEFCKSGHYNLCQEIQFCATPPVHGSLRKFYTHAADFCYKLPDHVSLEEGALLEPLSVGVHACKRAEVGIGSNLLILGSGPVGLVTLVAAKCMGAKKVAIADLMEYRLDLARKLKADVVYPIVNTNTEQENVDNISKLMECQPDITIDASGAESSIRLAIRITKAGGKVVLVGMGKPEMNIPLGDALVKELDIRGVFRYVNDYSDALDLVSTKNINLGTIVTHRYKFEETSQAFDTAKSTHSGAIKVIINLD
ncbi:sorbitol dehydrogenase isoform X2 [Nasonia vitripennis]|uniref:Sorbitol dehydrogenase n=1 Tax=Nasonia vitripennis TaxID=7425 RepID=A0A7M7Q683_NASVI|nr:sorbitol dehydrogenase isoform X2 [Nasonia vitripennis]